MKLTTTTTAAISVAVAAIYGAAAPAVASPSSPEAGDRIVYTFCADSSRAGTTNWFDADNDQRSFETTNLPTYMSEARWCGSQSFTSRSSFQMTGSLIQGGENSYFVSCAISVNGTRTASESATGKYAVASCA